MKAILCATGMIAAVLVIGCAEKKPAGNFGDAQSGAQAWDAADKAIAPSANTLAAIDSAKAFTQMNLANADASGFKALRCVIQNGRPKVTMDMDQGSLESTGRRLDLAISGDGFFRVKISPDVGDGYAYTRNGDFFMNANGEFVVGFGDGYKLSPPLSVPRDTTAIKISESGVVQVEVAGQTHAMVIGQINLYRFTNPQSLNRIEPFLLYQESAESGQAMECKPNEHGAGKLEQNFLEKSNVDLTREKKRLEYLNRWRDAVLTD